MKIDIQIIETHTDRGIEWGVSFDGCNPGVENYFGVIDRETAERLQERLEREFAT